MLLPAYQPITYRQLHERVAAEVHSRYATQIPQCEGDRVTCSGRNGKVVRTLGSGKYRKLLVDFDDGKREIVKAATCTKSA